MSTAQAVEKLISQAWQKCVVALEASTQERIAQLQKIINDEQAREEELAAQNELLLTDRDDLKNRLMTVQASFELLKRDRDRLAREKEDALSSLVAERKAAEEAIAVARQAAAEASGARNVLEKQVVELKAQLAEARTHAGLRS